MDLKEELFAHRCEHLFGAGWCFSYVRRNFLFREIVHSARGLFVGRLPGQVGQKELIAEDVKRAAGEICDALQLISRQGWTVERGWRGLEQGGLSARTVTSELAAATTSAANDRASAGDKWGSEHWCDTRRRACKWHLAPLFM